jgi:hypothetical protein
MKATFGEIIKDFSEDQVISIYHQDKYGEVEHFFTGKVSLYRKNFSDSAKLRIERSCPIEWNTEYAIAESDYSIEHFLMNDSEIYY